MAAVGVWPVPWALFDCRGGVAGNLDLSGRREGVVDPLGPVWPPFRRGRSPGPRLAALVAWLVPWAPSGRLGGVAGPLGPVWSPWGRGRSPGPRMVAMGAWPVPWAPYGRPVGVVGPLGPVWPPWGRGRPLGPVWLP